jgi:DUF1680 family protein
LFDELALSPLAQFKETFNPALLNGVTSIESISEKDTIHFIPYYAWDNREAGQMKVWINYNE